VVIRLGRWFAGKRNRRRRKQASSSTNLTANGPVEVVDEEDLPMPVSECQPMPEIRS